MKPFQPVPKAASGRRLRITMAMLVFAALVWGWFQIRPVEAEFAWEETLKETASEVVRDVRPEKPRRDKIIRRTVPALTWDGLPRQVSSQDKNGNGVNDTDDIIAGGRLEAGRKPVYKSAYYVGGYPPETEGVCTDVIWRALQHAGYDLKALMDADIKAHPSAYPRTGGKPDPHIDFRRVPNQRVFFQRHGLTLSTEYKPGDRDNMLLWQPGDLVTFKDPDHIAILSTKRNADGVPYLIHNNGPWASEGDDFPFWAERGITGHYRFPKN